jgi:hypothetical protein
MSAAFDFKKLITSLTASTSKKTTPKYGYT